MLDDTTAEIARDEVAETEMTVEQSRDALFDALSHRYRRFALAALCGRDEPVALADLAVEVTEQETGEIGENLSKERAREIEISLYHVHVPKLDDTGIVEFDRDRNTVSVCNEIQSVRGMA
jgi:DNA-binding transcriptional ArsR family regulator